MRALESSDFAAVDRGGSYIGFLPNDGRIIASFLWASEWCHAPQSFRTVRRFSARLLFRQPEQTRRRR